MPEGGWGAISGVIGREEASVLSRDRPNKEEDRYAQDRGNFGENSSHRGPGYRHTDSHASDRQGHPSIQVGAAALPEEPGWGATSPEATGLRQLRHSPAQSATI